MLLLSLTTIIYSETESTFPIKEMTLEQQAAFTTRLMKRHDFEKKAKKFKENFEQEVADFHLKSSYKRQQTLDTHSTQIFYLSDGPITVEHTPESNRTHHEYLLQQESKDRLFLHTLSPLEVLLLFKNSREFKEFKTRCISFRSTSIIDSSSFCENQIPKSFKEFEKLQKEYAECF